MAHSTAIRRIWQVAVAMTLLVAAPADGRAGPDRAARDHAGREQTERDRAGRKQTGREHAGRDHAERGGKAAGPARDAPVVGDAAGEDDALYRCGKAQSDVTINLRPGLKLAELAGWAMSFTCKNLVYSGAVGARQLDVTVMAPRPMGPPAAWRLFLVALEGMNLTVVPKGEFLEIVEAPTAKRHALPLFRRVERAPGGEELVRAIFRPGQVTSANLAQALTPLASGAGEIVELGWAGVVVVTDHGSHIAAMRDMMEEIDRPGSDQGLYFLPLRHAGAGDLVETLRSLLTPDAARTPAPSAPPGRPAAPAADAAPARILADERTNSLILLASRAAYERTRALVERLDVDVEGSGSGGRVHVHFVENTSAEKMAETLGALLGQRESSPAAGGRPGAARRGPVARTGGPAPAPAPGAGGPDSPIDLQGDVRVTADPLSNALLVLGSDRDDLALQSILHQLDVPRPQVFIEALIIEVGSGWSRTIGSSWHVGRLTRNGLWLGSLGHPQLSSLQGLGGQDGAAGGTGAAAAGAAAAAAGLGGFLGGVVGAAIPGAETLLGTSIPSFTVLFQALAQSNHVEILSAPQVMTTDHVEALLSAGETVPFVTGVTGLPGTAGGSVPVVERENVGLTLKVTPHVGASGKVRLDIDLVLEELLPGSSDLGPSTSKRQIKNAVVVGDQESAVLGGLMTHKAQTVETKIPLLGDFPVLGALFRRRETHEEKANLVVLITPYVVLDSNDSVRAVERVLERRGEFLGAIERLRRMGYVPGKSPRRLRGLVAEISRQVGQVDEERAVLRQLERQALPAAGPIDPAAPPAPPAPAPPSPSAPAPAPPLVPGPAR